MNDIKIEVITDPIEQEKIKPELDEMKKMALEPTKFELNEKERAAFEKWAENHGSGICADTKYCTGECFVFSFMPTGLATCVWVTCVLCKEKKDIGDYENI